MPNPFNPVHIVFDNPLQISVAINFDSSPGVPVTSEQLTTALNALGVSIVSALSDAIKAASDSSDAAIARVQTDVTNLKQQIADLEAQIANGGGTPADMQALADLKTKLDQLDPTSPTVLPPAPAPAPAPAP